MALSSRAFLSRLARDWAYRRQGPDRPPVRLRRRRVYILPTRQGMALAGLMAVMLLASINYSNSMGFALSFALAALALISMHHTHGGLTGLILRPGPVAKGFAGGTLPLRVQISNPAPQARRGIIVTDERGDRLARVDPGPGETVTATLAVPAQRRGPLRLRRFGLATEYPMGLFRAWCWLDLSLEGLAWPRPATRPARRPAAVSAARGRRQGEGSEDFAGLRPYRPGDSVRHIAWAAWARRDELLVKQFGAPHGESPIWLDWETAGPGDAEIRLSRLCRWILDASTEPREWGLRLPGRAIGPGNGAALRERALDALAHFGLTPKEARR
jgi:uncharacterized protein (DUF58 family)